MQQASKAWGLGRIVLGTLVIAGSFLRVALAQEPTAADACARYEAALKGKPEEILAAGAELLKLGRAAEPALPFVLKELDEPRSSEVREQAHELVSSIGVVALEPLLRRQIDEGRQGISGFRPKDEDAVSRLWVAYDAAGARERIWIAVVLDNLGKPSMEELQRRLKDSAAPVRAAAAQAARASAWRRELVVEALAPLVKDSDAAVRYWSTFALAGALPESLPALLEALASPDPRVRIAAAEGIEKSFDAVRSSSSHPDVELYEAWHGVTREMNHEYARFRATAETAVPKLAEALADSEPLVRMFAAVTLEKLGTKAVAALGALKEHADDPDPAVKFWVARAIERVSEGRWPNVEAFARAAEPVPATDEEVAGWLEALEQAPEWDPDPEADWKAADDKRGRAALQLARSVGRSWLEEAAGSGEGATKAAERLERVDDEVWRHVTLLLWISQSQFGAVGPASEELERLGPPTVRWLRQDYLRYPRFPIGDGSYDVHAHCLPKFGPAGLAALAHGLEHWYYLGVPAAADGLRKAGAEAALVAPLLVSGWRCVADDERAPGTNTWWDGATAGASALPAGWSIESSGGGSGEWGSGELFRRVSAGNVARGLGAGALPAFVAGLADESAFVRARCSDAVGALGEAGRPALPELAKRLDDKEEFVRARAARAVMEIAPAGAPERAKAEALLAAKK